MFYIPLLFLCFVTLSLSAEASSPDNGILVLRIRNADGSMGRVAVSKDESEVQTLSSLLSSYISQHSEDNEEEDSGKDLKCQICTSNGPSKQFLDVKDTNQSISSLDLKNGSIIAIVPTKRDRPKAGVKDDDKDDKVNLQRYTKFDPFPDIAKSSHTAAARRSRALSRLPSKRSMSYGDISKLRQHMHTIEPQAKGPITRIYMCHVGAQRFKDNCTIMPTKKQLKSGEKEIKIVSRCAVLFGSVNTERVNQSKRVARTSLSTPLYEMEMCKVAKVHAVWEPLNQNNSAGNVYDSKKICNLKSSSSDAKKELERAVKIADSLGLKMIGWIYSYSDDRQGNDNKESNEGALPVFGGDLVVGAMTQIDNMERIGSDDGKQFITLALDANTGATEAFQLSDASVQMVAEGKLTVPDKISRILEAKEAIVIDTKETTSLDSVLCLVNTAMLSHEGSFSGNSGKKSYTKKSGALTANTRKALLTKFDGNDEDLISLLCNFEVLMALDRLIAQDKMSELCMLVKKYSRGQRKAAQLSNNLRLVLKNVLGG